MTVRRLFRVSFHDDSLPFYFTLSVADLTDFLGYGKEKRRAGNADVLYGRKAFK